VIRVALTWYPLGSNEKTVWVTWPAIPAVGSTVHLDDNTPAMYIRRMSMVPDDWVGKDDGTPIPDNWPLWHLEVWLTDRMPI
jgi:hypothetical protein